MKNRYLYPTFAVALLLFIWGCNSTGIPDSYTLIAGAVPEQGGTIIPAEEEEFESGSEIVLEATSADGFTFMHWEGDHEGEANPDTVIIEGDMQVSAVFERRDFSLNIEVEGEGMVREEVVETPEKADYPYGTTVELTAEPESGWEFERWEGDLSGDENPQTVVIDDEQNVTAVFERDFFFFSLASEAEPVEGGTVEPASGNFEEGMEVEVEAIPADGYIFMRWEGALSGRENPQTLQMDEDKSVRALFTGATVSHGYVDGVTPNREPVFAERTYPVLVAEWDGPGGDKRWLGVNLGANAPQTSLSDDDAYRAGWYFQFNRSQGFHHDGRVPHTPPGFETGPVSGPPREDSDWESQNDPCRLALGESWRIPTAEEWRAAAEAGAESALGLHLAGYLSRTNGNLFDSRGQYGAYWSRSQFSLSATNAIFAELNEDGEMRVRNPRNKKDGLTVRCIEA